MIEKFQKSRRRFLKQTAAGLAGASLSLKTGWPQSTEENSSVPLRVKEFRTLGRTGFKVSDIGAGAIQDEGVMAFALDAGVNYIDTAEQYPGHHRLLAKVLKGRDRKSIFLSTKLEVLQDTSKEGFLKRARKCLEELETDYVDCLMMHMPEKAELLKTEGFHAAMQELKAEGRVRFVGVSNHGSFWYKDPEETMEKVLLAAAEDGRFDVFLLAYNFLKMDQSEKVLEVCRQKNIGTALMKTTPIAIYYTLKSRVDQLQSQGKEVSQFYLDGVKRYKDKADRADEFIKAHNLQKPEEIMDAAIRFCLDNENVSTVCCLAKTYQEMESFIHLSGTRLNGRDGAKLQAYREGCGELYCRHACGVCEPACPNHVPVNTIMRYHQYFAAQSREREAMGLYAGIPGNNAEVCRECPGYCEAACPYHVSIQGMLLVAHADLSMP